MVRKLLHWDGTNKGLVRNEKAKLALKHYPTGSSVISLPGANAKFEKLLLEGGAPAQNIFGIQTVYQRGSHNGERIYNCLKENSRGGLEKMPIWPWEVSEFFKRLDRTKLDLTGVPPKAKKFLNKNPIPKTIPKISVIDLDMCGIFGKYLLDTIEYIFSGKSIRDKFLLFVNIQKGRDVKKGRLFELLCTYGIDYIEHAGDLAEIRYKWFPYVINSIGHKYGYIGTTERLYEYSDKNPSGAGVNMLQYVFTFEKGSGSIKQTKYDYAEVFSGKIEWRRSSR